MTAAATSAVIAATLATCVAALCRGLSRAPGWRDLRLFSYVCLTAAIYCALSIPSNLGAAGPQVVLCARIKLVVAGSHVLFWLRYANDQLRLTPRRWERWYGRALLVGCASALVPGLVYEEETGTRVFSPLRLVYTQSVATRWGILVFAAVLAVFGLLALRYWRAWQRDEPYAAVHCSGLVVLMLLGVNDALAVSSPLRLPHLLELGCVIPMGAVAYSLVARFAGDARDLARLRVELETRVAERTRELACAVDALHRSEKLAAMGQLAAGVAHEVNTPIAVVVSNLQFLAESLERGEPLPQEAASCITDSLTATGRISHIARQLLQAGRLAGSAAPCESVSVAEAAVEAIRASRERCGAHVRFESLVPAHLAVFAQEDAVVQVLVNLLVNAGQAIPESRRDGRVWVHAERAANVRIVVEDNGAGMSADTLARAFEPFFSTKPFGSGTGLGLAVSRGLIEGLGGSLWLESELGSGTRAVIEFPAAGAESVSQDRLDDEGARVDPSGRKPYGMVPS
jgi:signal transduction histidine kinase